MEEGSSCPTVWHDSVHLEFSMHYSAPLKTSVDLQSPGPMMVATHWIVDAAAASDDLRECFAAMALLCAESLLQSVLSSRMTGVVVVKWTVGVSVATWHPWLASLV